MLEEETPDVTVVVMGTSSLTQPSVPWQPIVVTQTTVVAVVAPLLPDATMVTGLGG